MPEEPPQVQKPQMPPATGLSATVGKRRPPTGVSRQKSSGLNSDIPTDLLLEAQSMLKTGFRSTNKLSHLPAATPTGNKSRKPLPKRGKSAHPGQRPPVSQNDLTKFSWSNAVSGATNTHHLAYNSTTSMTKRQTSQNRLLSGKAAPSNHHMLRRSSEYNPTKTLGPSASQGLIQQTASANAGIGDS